MSYRIKFLISNGLIATNKLLKRLVWLGQDLFFSAVILSCRYLPLSVIHRIFFRAGQLVFTLSAKQRRYALANLSLCLPMLSAARRKEIARLSTCEIFKIPGEQGHFMNLPIEAIRRLVKRIDGESIKNQAMEKGPVIYATIHIGCWEIIAAGLHIEPVVGLYRGNYRLPILYSVINKARIQVGWQPYLTKGTGSIKHLLRTLKSGKSIILLTDGAPGVDAGKVTAPLFNRPVPTMTLLSRLAQHTHAPVVFVTTRRVADGYHVRCFSMPEEIYSRDLTVSATALNGMIEQAILDNPEQYFWSYKRFRRGAYSHIYRT